MSETLEPGAGRGGASDGMSAKVFFGLLALAVALALGLRLYALGADTPLTLSMSNSEMMDGPWYLAEAVDGAHGLPVDVPHYRKPIYTWLASAAYAIAGEPSLEATLALQGVLGALAVLFVGLAGASAFGRRAGLLGALLFSVGYLPIGYSRTTLVYGPLIATLALCYWLYAAGLKRGWLVGLAWVALALTAAGLKAHAALLAPAFGVGMLAHARRPWRSLLALVVLGLLATGVIALLNREIFRLTLGKISFYMGEGSFAEAWKRAWNNAYKSGLLLKAPALFGLGWIGVLAALRNRPAPGPGEAAAERHRLERGMEAALAVGLVVWVATFSPFRFAKLEGVIPLRHFVPVLLPAAILGGRVLDRLIRGEPFAPSGGQPESDVATAGWLLAWVLRTCWAVLTTYWVLGCIWTQVYRVVEIKEIRLPRWAYSLVDYYAILLCSLGIVLLISIGAYAALRRWTPETDAPVNRGTRRRLALIALALGLIVDAMLVHGMLSRPTYTLRAINRRVIPALIGENAHLAGNWAHAVTFSSPDVTRQLPELGAWKKLAEQPPPRPTHLVVDGPFRPFVVVTYQRMGLDVIPIAFLKVRDHAIVIFRFPWAEEVGYKPTELELELQRLVEAKEGDDRALDRLAPLLLDEER